MMRQKKLFSIVLLFVFAGIAVWIFCIYFSINEQGKRVKVENIPLKQKGENVSSITEKSGITRDNKAVESEIEKAKTSQSSLLENVPFTSQAPFGEWNNPIFQNGCEEAALVMAQYWLTGKTLTKDVAKKEIIAISNFEKKEGGQSIDTSVKDTAKLLRDYYGVMTSDEQTDITVFDIQETLASGALVIVPADGRKLQNPNYTQPGPTTHMLVIIGYDAEKKEFITNDSGTRNGKEYRYKETILFEAIRDYPTGDHLPIKEIKKSMIVVRKP